MADLIKLWLKIKDLADPGYPYTPDRLSEATILTPSFPKSLQFNFIVFFRTLGIRTEAMLARLTRRVRTLGRGLHHPRTLSTEGAFV